MQRVAVSHPVRPGSSAIVALLSGALSACVVLSSSLGPAHAAPLDLSGYTLTFEEDFRYLDISAHGPHTRWTAHTPWGGDFGDAAFDDPGPAGPFAIAPDGLRITAHKDDAGKWHSGLISSMDKDGPGQHGFAQRYGYFEIRTRLPDGPGVWPAFWLIGIDKSKSSAEIDILEYYGKFNDGFHSVQHVWTNGKDTLDRQKNTLVPPHALTSDFNTYGVLVGPERLTFYRNGESYWETPTPPEYKQPFYVLANLALGGGWPIDALPSPVTMTISSIRVYQNKAWAALP